MRKISGLLFTDHIASVAGSSLPDKIKITKDIECTGVFRSQQAMLCYGNRDNLHRPYLYLKGHIAGLTGNFPCNINEVKLGDKGSIENPGPAVAFQLEFSQEELAELCHKGLFTSEFKCPDIFVDNDFEMPIRCDCKYIEPEKSDEVPLLFIDIKNQYNIQMNAVDTGYDLTSYFEEITVNHTVDDVLNYSDIIYQADNSYEDDEDFLFKNEEENTVTKQPDVIENDKNETSYDVSEEKDLYEHRKNIEANVNNKLAGNIAESPVVKKVLGEKSTDMDGMISKERNEINGYTVDVSDEEIIEDDDVIEYVNELCEDEENNRETAVSVNQNENAEGDLKRRKIPSEFDDVITGNEDIFYTDDEFD